MFKIKIVAVGKIKEHALAELIAEYAKRLGRYCALEIAEVEDESVSAREGAASVARYLALEAGRLRGRLREGVYTVALDAAGAAPDSVALAKKLETLTCRFPEAAFVLGGSHGLHPDVLTAADYRLSLSNLTFPHQLARLVLLEQLYRAFKINNNETYHK